jgi:low temperature requirement protein LtrA
VPVIAHRSARSRPWLRPPVLLTLGSARREERRASWLELFFDLVFVVAIAQLAEQLVHEHDLRGFAIFGGLFLPVYIAWQGFSFYADRFDTDDVLFRVVILAGMLAVAALAVQVPDVAEGRRSAGFVVAYVTLRTLLVALYLRVWPHVPEARPLVVRYAGGYSVSIAIWLASLLVAPPGRYVFWAVGLALEYLMPPLARRIHERIPTDVEHVPERFALFTLIVLGESIVAVALGTAGQAWAFASASTAALGFVAIACIWWVYFDRGIAGGLKRAPGTILVFSYVQIPLLAALTAVGAGLHLLIEEADGGHVAAGAAWGFGGGAALYLVCLSVCQHMTAMDLGLPVKVVRYAVAAALVVLAALAGHFEPATYVGLCAAALVGLVAAEIRAGLAASGAEAS